MLRIIKILILLVFVLSTPVFAQVTVSGHSGTWTHGSSVTVTGSGFGTKSTAAPTIWDNCSGTTITDLWSGAWPTISNSATYGTTYRTPAQVGRGITLPHSHVTKYISGSHYSSGGADAGYDVMVWRNRTISSFPAYSYISWYQRFDNNWTFGDDNNLKAFDFSTGTSPYDPTNWYVCYAPTTPSSSSGGTDYAMLDDAGTSLQNPDNNGHSYIYWWTGATNPMSGVWTKIEMEIVYTNQNSGTINLYENGNLKIYYSGRTNNYGGTAFNEGIGGYARNQVSSNWRYYNDLYLDNSLARVVVCPGSTWATRGVCHNVIPTSWSSSSISGTLNQGALADSSTAYVYVVDSSGNYNSSGHSVTLGSSGGDTTAPSVTISQGSSVTVRKARTTTLTGTCSDAVGVSWAKWRVGAAPDADNGTACTADDGTFDETSEAWSCAVTNLGGGSNDIRVGCGDAAGNVGTATINVEVTKRTWFR